MNNSFKKKVSVANFNIVFLDKNENEYPLLDYFDSVLMPALRSGIVRKSGGSTFLIMDTDIKGSEEDGYVLTCFIVKETMLEVKSVLDSSGSLIDLDNSYPSAPFSTFVIHLRNHRMVLVENQKGSPNIKNFRSTIAYILNQYVIKTNNELDKEETHLPTPDVNIVGIAPKGGIMHELRRAKKVSRLTLKFYPLNGDGDIDFSKLMGEMTKDVRKMVGSKTGSIVYNSPKNINGLIKLVEATEGTVDPHVLVIYPDDSKGTITYDNVSEKRTMNINEGDRSDAIDSIIFQSKKIDSINFKSEENNDIYEKNKSKIIKYKKEE